MKKEIERICKNCGLFNPSQGVCGVTILKGGEEYEITTKPEDSCHWDAAGKAIGEDLLSQIKEMRIWHDGKKHHIQYPDDVSPKYDL